MLPTSFPQTGSPHYLAPEVLQQQAYSLECDVYSLGCLLYEMAALRPPFSGHDLKTLKINVSFIEHSTRTRRGLALSMPLDMSHVFAICFPLMCLMHAMPTWRLPCALQVLMGRLERIPSQHSDELWQIIHAMLNPDPGLRPSIHTIMSEPCVRQRQQLLPPFASAGTDVADAQAAAAGPPAVCLRNCVLDTLPVS